MSIYKKCSLVLISVAFISGLAVYYYLPTSLASHWDIFGNVDGFMPRFLMVFLFPVLAAMSYLLSYQVVSMDPLIRNYHKFRTSYDEFVASLVNFFVYIHLLILSYNLGYTFNMTRMMVPAFMILFYYIGSLMDSVEQNWFIGIRNPWTLSDKQVWAKTHKFGSFLFKSIAALTVFMFFDPLIGFFVMVGSIALAVFGTEIYSYMEYRKLNHR